MSSDPQHLRAWLHSRERGVTPATSLAILLAVVVILALALAVFVFVGGG